MQRRSVIARSFVASILCLVGGTSALGAQSVPTPSEIDAWIEASMERWDVPGLGLAIVYDGESYVSRGYGVKELGLDAPVDGGTLFSIGSCSKAFGAATLAGLVEDGELTWDDRIVDHLPWFRLHDGWTTREIRVRDIVTHRVGTGSNQQLRPIVRNRRDYLSRLPFTEPVHAFRDRYGYTNDMLVLTGELVETVSGQSWDDYARARIWSPLGMSTTTARMGPANASSNHAEPHAFVERRFVGSWNTPGPALEPVAWQYAEDVTVPSGGVISSADEMTEWMRMHVGTHPRAPLSRASIARMHTPHTVMQEPNNWVAFEGPGAYAMGWATGRFGDVTTVSHAGNALGFNCSIALVPEHGFGVWATVNRNSELPWVITKWAVSQFFGDEALRSRDWNAEHEVIVDGINQRSRAASVAREAARIAQGPSLPLAAYAGRFHSPYGGPLEIRLADDAPPALTPAEGRGGRWDATPGSHERGDSGAATEDSGRAGGDGAATMLVLSLAGRERPLQLPLEHWHVDQFDAWYGDLRIGVRFQLDGSGRVTGVELDYYGLFERTEE